MILQDLELPRPIRILLVEDSPSDAELTRETLRHGRLISDLWVVEDGVEALTFLRGNDRFSQAPRPDLVVLDLNMPLMNGREVMAEMKSDNELRNIPIVVLTASQVDQDVVSTYHLRDGCYLTKPLDFGQFMEALHSIGIFLPILSPQCQAGE